MNDLVLYEFPLNERIRVFMRLEQLFQQIDHFLKGSSIWESRAVISTLLEILTIFSRNDLKSEILKEVDRHASVLNKMASSQQIDRSKLESILGKLNTIGDELYATPGKIGYSLMENELFKCISQRSSIPGGTCAFDLPAYHYWLQQEETQRKQDLEHWLRRNVPLTHQNQGLAAPQRATVQTRISAPPGSPTTGRLRHSSRSRRQRNCWRPDRPGRALRPSLRCRSSGTRCCGPVRSRVT